MSRQTILMNWILLGVNATLAGLSTVLLIRVLNDIDKVSDKVDMVIPQVQVVQSQTDRNTQDIKELFRTKFSSTKRDHTYEGEREIF